MASFEVSDTASAADQYGIREFAVRDLGAPAHLTVVSNVEGEVMRITADGIFVNPNVSADLAAQIVIAALEQHIRHLVADKDAEIARLRCELEKKERH